MAIVAAYMVPHPPIAVAEIGKGEEQKIRQTLESYRRVAVDIAAQKPDTIILTSPHSVMYRDYFHISPGTSAYGDFGSFRAPQTAMNVLYDEELGKIIERFSHKVGIPAGTKGELDPRLDHGTMVPLYFINQQYKDYKLVRIGLSGLSLDLHVHFGEVIAHAVEALGRRAVFVASGDLSHCQKEDGPYGYKEAGPEYDERIMDVMGRGAFEELLDFDEEFLSECQECGHRSFVIMSGVWKEKRFSVERLSHEATFGVGYGFCIYHGEDLEDRKSNDGESRRKREDPWIALARKTIEEYITNGEIPEKLMLEGGGKLPDEFTDTRAGVFVSIHEHGMLRGCIGTISPVQDNLAEEIIANAVSASTRDPRFSPIAEEELPFLEISVDVLAPAEHISSKEELDVKRYGVIVENGYRRGLLLPNLDGVDTVEEQIAIARRKAGIREDEEIRLSRFEVVRHECT